MVRTRGNELIHIIKGHVMSRPFAAILLRPEPSGPRSETPD